MTDVLTSAKSLAKQETGTNDATWGQNLNASIELIDKAIGQTVTVAITGNTVITAEQAKYGAVKLTGSPGGDKTVTWPTYYGPLIVKNAMTDGSAAVCGMASGLTVTVYPGGGALIIFSDGTDFVQTTRRRLLAANTTFVVNFGSGNDTTGNGSAAAPWKTLQKAIDWLVANIDGGGKTILVSQAGLDTDGVVILTPILGAASVVLELNGGILTANPYGVYASGGGVNVALAGTGTVRGATNDVVATNGANVSLGGITVGACTGAKILAQVNSRILITGNYGETGNSYAHWQADTGGKIVYSSAALMTQGGAPAYSGAFAVAILDGTIHCPVGLASFFAAGATGAKKLVATGGGINRGADDLPGNSAGTVDGTSFGWYA